MSTPAKAENHFYLLLDYMIECAHRPLEALVHADTIYERNQIIGLRRCHLAGDVTLNLQE